MFLSKFRFLRTVKFRIAAFYAGVFAFSSLCSFLLVYWFQYSSLINTADQRLNELVNNFEFEYLTGGEFRLDQRILTLNSLPPQVLSAISRKVPGLKPLFAYADSAQGDGCYFIFGTSARALYSFEVKSDSLEVTVKEISPAQRIASLKHEFNEESYGEGRNQLFFLLVSSGGEVLARSPFRERYLPLFLSQLDHLSRSASWNATAKESHRELRLSCRRLFDGNCLMAGYNLKRINHNMRSLAILFYVVEGFLLLVGALTGWLLARHFIRGVDRVRHTATMIASGDFSLRVAHGNEGEEIDNLVDSFNAMTRNTEQLFKELKTISDDIAHDLRTPITRMRGMAELAISRGKDSELAYEIVEECCNMLGMINTMLEITKAESGIHSEPFADLNLSDLLFGVVDLFSSVAEDKGIKLALTLPENPVFYRCPKVQFQRMIGNLLDNALKFTPSGGSVSVTLVKSLSAVTLAVKDTGCGIAYEDQMHVFERFFRADSSRSLPGNGLGLSLVDAIVKSCHGTLRLSSAPGKGTCLTIAFPL